MILQEMLREQREAGYAEGEARGVTKGIVKGKLEGIFDLLNDLPGEVSEEVQKFLSAEDDCNVLSKYLRLAASASSVEEFVQQLPM